MITFEQVLEYGKSLGATIVQTYNLMDRGITWEPNVKALPVYQETLREIRDLFERL